MKVVAAVWAFAGFLAVIAAVAIVVGAHDAALAQADFAITAGGAVLVAFGVVLCIATYHLARLARNWEPSARGRPQCRSIVPLAFFLTIIVGVYVGVGGLRGAGEQRVVVVFVSALMIGAGILGLWFFEADVTLRKLGAAVVLGLLGTTIGIWEFWYSNQYVPSHAGHAVELKAELTPIASSGPYEVVKATLSYEAIGAKSVSVLGSAYTLTGSHVVRCRRAPTTEAVGDVFGGFLPDPQRTRYMADVWERLPPTLLAAGKFVGDGKRLDPDVSLSRDFLFRVPRDEYQLLRLRAQVFAIPASVPISQRITPEYMRFRPDNELYGFWHIDDDSWFHDVVSGRERWVVLRYEIVDPANTRSTRTTPDLRVTARFPSATWRYRMPGAEVERLFAKSPPSDSNEAFAGTEMALEPVVQPAAGEAQRLHCE